MHLACAAACKPATPALSTRPLRRCAVLLLAYRLAECRVPPFAARQDYDWGRHGGSTLCDVGGGSGRFLAELLRRWPGMRGVLLDRQARGVSTLSVHLVLMAQQHLPSQYCSLHPS